MSEKIVLIDGHSILNRAFYGVPELTNSEGKHTNAVYGFLNILFKVLEEEKPQYLAVAFDVKAPTFRHKMFEEYKGTRKPMPEELHEQVPMMKEMLRAMNVTVMELPGFEADDILGTMAKRSEAMGREVSVVSGDRDLLQLASDHICVRIPTTKRGVTTVDNYFAADVLAAKGVTPLQFIDMKALMGDTSDNIPGVPGIGEKGAASIIAQFGSIENAYEHVDEVNPKRAREALREHYDLAQMSKVLATIDVNAPVDEAWMTCVLGDLYTKEAYELVKRYEFKSMTARFDLAGMEAESAEPADVTRTVMDLAEVEEIFAKARKAERVGLFAAWDTQGLAGVALCMDAAETLWIPVAWFVTEDYLIHQMSELEAKAKHLVMMDGKMWFKLLPETCGERAYACLRGGEGKTLPYLMDMGVAAYLLNPLKSTYGYDDIARDVLGRMVPAQTDLLGKQSLTAALREEKEEAVRCACLHASVPFAAVDLIWEKLQAEGAASLYEEVELPLIVSLNRMEREGIKVEKDELAAYGARLAVRIAELEKEIYALAGMPFNINSPKQLGEILFEQMGLPGGKKTKTGYSTAADVLEKLAPEYPIVDKILEYRTLAKLKSTYADGLAGYIQEDGRIHGIFNQTVTATGRLSSTEPNLQNIPVRMELGREIRKLFVPKDGCVLVDADYSQIELRVLAHMSGDEQLIEAYNQAQDIHAITASKVFHVPLEEVTSELRRNAKAVNFGIVYGISAFGLSEDLSISRKDALDYINQYFATYPKVKAFLDQTVADAKELGYAVTLFGRRRPVPELKSSNFMQRSFGERVAMNSPIQGTAADIIKIAMVRVDERLHREGLASRLILQVHDELIVEAVESEVAQVCCIMEEEMKGAAALEVALEIDMHTGKSWYETK
ncbi:MAG: DNA polymerase I [Lachnospiraceae bacterium]|nr:DNA polymerase I [Lachnospiraceae bacterium]